MTPLLEAEGLAKAYAGVQALQGVGFDLRAGEIHALCGENGAGKSTLIKILGGILPWGTYGGVIRKGGVECQFHGPRDALASGIVVIHQELSLAPSLTVSGNIFLGREWTHRGMLDHARMDAKTRELLNVLGQTDIRPDQCVQELTVGKMQMVEVARALLPTDPSTGFVASQNPSSSQPDQNPGSSGNGRVLILDEPTSALSSRESEILLELLVVLKQQGTAIVYVSHKLDEVFAIADRITVLRNGQSIETMDRPDAAPNRVVAQMVGRPLEQVFPNRTPAPAKSAVPLLRVRDWTVPSAQNPLASAITNLSFDLHAGEILGLAGLMGAGRTELVESLFGLGPKGKGDLQIDGVPFHPNGAGASVAHGLALVPEDRRLHGLMLEKSVRHNLTSACLKRFCKFGQILDEDAEIHQSALSIGELGVKTPHGEFVVGMLSGGNQQKVVLAKWLLTHPRILFLDDPTRGVDVGAKSEIYRIIQNLSQQGIGIVLISSENEEVWRLSHRILVLRQGHLVGECAPDTIDPAVLFELCAKGSSS